MVYDHIKVYPLYMSVLFGTYIKGESLAESEALR